MMVEFVLLAWGKRWKFAEVGCARQIDWIDWTIYYFFLNLLDLGNIITVYYKSEIIGLNLQLKLW